MPTLPGDFNEVDLGFDDEFEHDFGDDSGDDFDINDADSGEPPPNQSHCWTNTVRTQSMVCSLMITITGAR